MFGQDFGGHEGFGPFSGHDGFGPGGFGPGFGGRMRAGRGMMEPAILQALLDKPMHGYEIITTLEERSHGMWRPSAGSVYPTLQLLEEKDYLSGEDRDGKKVYTLTEAGKTAAEEAKEKHGRHEETWKDRMKAFSGAQDIRAEFGQAMIIMRDIMHTGSDEQKQQIKLEINKFTEALERIQK